MEITKDIKHQFINAFIEALCSCSDYDIYQNQPYPAECTLDEIKAHCLSFLYRAWPYYLTENRKRAENNQPQKTIECLGHDFYFTSFGSGVGFWETSETDWLYYNEILTKLAEKYFYNGCSAYVGDNGLLYIE